MRSGQSPASGGSVAGRSPRPRAARSCPGTPPSPRPRSTSAWDWPSPVARRRPSTRRGRAVDPPRPRGRGPALGRRHLPGGAVAGPPARRQPRRGIGIGDAGYQVSVDGQCRRPRLVRLHPRPGTSHQGRPTSSANMFREAATIFGDLGHPGRRWGIGGHRPGHGPPRRP